MRGGSWEIWGKGGLGKGQTAASKNFDVEMCQMHLPDCFLLD